MVEKSDGEKSAPIELPSGVHTPHGPHTPWVMLSLFPPHFSCRRTCTLGPPMRPIQSGTPPDSQTKALMHRAPTAPPRDGALATTPHSGAGAGGASRAPVQAEIAAPCSNLCQGKSGSNGADRASSLRPKR